MVTFPEADPQQGQTALRDAAGCAGGNGAQEETLQTLQNTPGCCHSPIRVRVPEAPLEPETSEL